MTLVKVRLLLDLQALQDAVQKAAPGNMTMEQKMGFLQEEALSDVLLSRPDIIGRDDFGELVADLRRQSLAMFKAVQKCLLHF